MATKINDITLTKQSSTLTLNAKGKYVDDNKYFEINVKNGAASAAATADADIKTDASSRNISSIIGEKASSAPASGYYLAIEAEGGGTASVTTAGWMNQGDLDGASATADKYFPVTASTLTQNAPTVNSSGLVTATSSATKGYTPGDTDSATLQLSTQDGKTVSPTESEQTAVTAGKYTIGAVKVGAISSSYVGSGIARNSNASLNVEGDTVSVPAGYYATAASASVAGGSVTQNAPTINTSTGVVTATSTVTEGYVAAGTKSNTLSLSTQGAKTVTPTESEQTAVAAGKYTTGIVKVGAISSTYVGSDIPKNDDTDLSVSGATVTVPAGYYEEDASASVVNGSVTQNAPTINSTGLITATSTVTAGYVTAGTKSNTLQMTTKGATSYPYTTLASSTISAGTYLTGDQTILQAYTSGISAGNIKHGQVVKVGDTDNNGRIHNITGTFTKASTVSSGQTAAAAGQIRSGYSAWVDGAEVKGSLGNTSVSQGTTTVSGTTATRGNATWGNGVISSGSIGAAAFKNSATSGKTYVDISNTTDAPVLVSGGYLYIDKGYTDDLKISLAKLVPDGASANLASGVILSGYSAYNNDGTLIAGDIPTKTALTVNGKTVTAPAGYYASDISASVAVGSVKSGSASITSLTKAYNTTSGKFDVSGSANVSAPSVTTAGYVSSSEGTRSANNGGATVSTTMDKIVGSTAITGASTRKPSISKQATPTGVTNAASGDATTSAPSSGIYVAVKSAANTGTLTATPSVTTEGYGTSDYHGIAGNTATVGALASDTTYIPITTTSASVSGKTVSYGSGWITEGSKSVADGAYSASVSAHSISTVPVVTGALSGQITNIGTTTKPSGTDGTDYWSVTPGVSLTTTGKSTAKGKATIGTAGYITTGNKETDASVIDITPTRNNGTTRYLTKAASSTTNGTATATAGTASTSVTGMATTSTNTGYSVSASATGGNASVTASSVTVGTGYNPSSVTASTSAASDTGANASQTKYIQKGVLSATVSSNSSGSASMAATGFTPLASGTSSYYVTLATSAGSVKAKASVETEGYVKTETTETSATSVSVSGNGNKLYIPAGGYAGSVSTHSISTTPVVTGSISGTVTNIGTTTKPSSGTDGTDYWTITPSGSVTTTGVSTAKGKATISTAGYIPTGNNESSASTVNITPTVSNGSARYLVKSTTSVSNGTATATNGTASTSVTGMATSETDTGYAVSASATGGNASVTVSSATVNAGYNPSSITASTTAKNATGTSSSQTKYIQKGVLSASVSSNSAGSASMAATGFTAASSATSYYVTLSTSAGSVKAKASVGTEGYVKSETNETAATSVSVSGNGNKLYIPAGGITPTISNSGLSTYFDSGTSSDKNLTLTPQYTNTAGYIPAHSTAQSGTAAYYKIKTASASVSGKTVSYGTGWITGGSKSVADSTMTQGTTTVSGTTATRGNLSWTAGYLAASSLGAATFANEATSGQTYVDISSTTSAPVLVAGDYLYINKGYTDNLKISLARLVPDGSDVKGHGNYILSGHSAYDNDGTLVAGSIATLTAGEVSVNGKTVTIPAGKYTGGTAISKSVADGSVTPAVNSHTITAPTATGSLGGTVTNIGTTTKPSGTDGTDYWTITPGVTSVKGSSVTNAKATVSAGYIASSPANSGNSTKDIVVTTSNGTARYLTKATSSTSNGTATATNGTASTSVTGMVTTNTNTGYSVSASATGGNASVTASSVTVGAGYNPSSVTASTTAKSATGTSASDTKYIQKGVLSASVSSNSGGSASMAATGFTPLASGTSSYYVTLSTSAGSVKAKASVGTEGYVKSETNETSATSVAVSGNGTKMYIPAGGYAGSVSSHSITTTPVVTGAISGTVTSIGTTTKPSSGTDGTDYWTITPGGSVTTTGVSSAKGKATISTAGYIPTGNNESGAHTVNITPTVSNGSARYLTKATSSTSNGTATATAGTASTSVTGMVTTTTNTGYSVSASATGGNASVTASSVTVNAGYNPSSVTASTSAASQTGANASQTKYIQKGALSASVSSNSSGSASMAATGMATSSTATSYYVTLSTSAGSVKAKASVNTEGYVKTETNETAATSVAVSGNGNKLYIQAAAIAGSSTNASATTTVQPGAVTVAKQSVPSGVTNAASGDATTTAPSSGVYVAVKATAAANTTGTTSSISGSGTATVSTAGYAPSTLTGTVSVSGTATAKTSERSSSVTYVPITTATPTFSSPIPGGGSTATGTNCTLGNSNTSGISVQTKYTVNAANFSYSADVNGWVSKTKATIAGSTSARGSTNGTNYYLTGVSIPKPSGDTENTFTVTVPNGTSSTINFVFHVDKNGNVRITES